MFARRLSWTAENHLSFARNKQLYEAVQGERGGRQINPQSDLATLRRCVSKQLLQDGHMHGPDSTVKKVRPLQRRVEEQTYSQADCNVWLKSGIQKGDASKENCL